VCVGRIHESGHIEVIGEGDEFSAGIQGIAVVLLYSRAVGVADRILKKIVSQRLCFIKGVGMDAFLLDYFGISSFCQQ
jgi:hypothetical protein